jgi:hypothetical protein
LLPPARIPHRRFPEIAESVAVALETPFWYPVRPVPFTESLIVSPLDMVRPVVFASCVKLLATHFHNSTALLCVCSR